MIDSQQYIRVIVCLLYQDLPRPDFMLKDPAERTEEEIRAAIEFEKKEAAFLEEREKLKKALEGELRKLQSTISQAMESFDERLHKLFQLKINTEMAIHQVHVPRACRWDIHVCVHVCALCSSVRCVRRTFLFVWWGLLGAAKDSGTCECLTSGGGS